MQKISKPIKTIAIRCLLIIVGILCLITMAPQANAASSPVYVVELDGAITTGQKNFLERQVENALAIDAQLFVVVMNTPGGLVDATLEINRLFLNAPIPIAVLVAPSGAIAGSAGAFILVSSDIAAMAPGTTVGAAQPVTISPEGTTAADEKTTVFYASHLRSMAREKGRPEDLAAKFVTENFTLDARDALEVGMIDYIVNSVSELIDAVDGTIFEKQGKVYTLNTASAEIYRDEMNLRERVQNWLSDPQISFLILILGVLGIYFGLSAPGTIVPEVSGVILVVLGIYGIGLFDTNTTGIMLLLLGTGLIIAEIFTSGFGILGIGGAVSMVVGAIMLPVEPLMAREWYTGFLITVIGTVLALVIIILVVAQRVIKSRRQWSDGSTYFNPPQKGVTVTDLNPEGMIKSRGELWKARSEKKIKIASGTEVEVIKADTLLLVVRPLQDSNEES